MTADYACSDTPAGVVECTRTLDSGAIADGDPLDTTTLGEHTFTVTATDNAGNTAARTHHHGGAGGRARTVTETGTGTPPEGTWVIVPGGGLRPGGWRRDRRGRDLVAAGRPRRLPPRVRRSGPSHVIEWYDGHGYRDLAQADTASATAAPPRPSTPTWSTPPAVSGTVTKRAPHPPRRCRRPCCGRVSHPLAARPPRDADGHYRLTGLPPGAYLVVSALAQGTHAATFFGDTMDADAATPSWSPPAPLRPGPTSRWPQRGRPLAGSVTGTVTDDVTGDPEPGVPRRRMQNKRRPVHRRDLHRRVGPLRPGVDGGDFATSSFDLDTATGSSGTTTSRPPARSPTSPPWPPVALPTPPSPPRGGSRAVTEDGTVPPRRCLGRASWAMPPPARPARRTAADGTYAMPAVDIGDYYEGLHRPTGAHALRFNDDAPTWAPPRPSPSPAATSPPSTPPSPPAEPSPREVPWPKPGPIFGPGSTSPSRRGRSWWPGGAPASAAPSSVYTPPGPSTRLSTSRGGHRIRGVGLQLDGVAWSGRAGASPPGRQAGHEIRGGCAGPSSRGPAPLPRGRPAWPASSVASHVDDEQIGAGGEARRGGDPAALVVRVVPARGAPSTSTISISVSTPRPPARGRPR